ncbi:undecaprenyl-diphosphate phosphatase [Lentzea sp. NPDC006480]|uniref:caspase, EACC1-associated type n=1 Tax=Lentzea sp. NPDC006480 TaxID=3157176 RepID=UPI0033BA1A80
MRLPAPSNSYAVLVGTSTYANAALPALPAVRHNLDDLRAVLTDPGLSGLAADHCVTVPDPTDVRTVYRELRRQAARATDTLIIYFAGHGLTGPRNELFLGLVDTETDELPVSALAYDLVRGIVANSPARNRVVILDCCFSGRAAGDMAGDDAILGQVGIEGTYVLTSAPANAVALAPPGARHTAFTGELLRLVRAGVPEGPELLTFGMIYRHLLHTMTSLGLPLPQQRGTGTADLLALTRNPAHPAATQPEVAHAAATPPEVAHPEIAQPAATQPEAVQSAATHPGVAQPTATHLGVARPAVTQPEFARPEIAHAEVAHADVPRPEVAHADVAYPEVAHADVPRPEVAHADVAHAAGAPAGPAPAVVASVRGPTFVVPPGAKVQNAEVSAPEPPDPHRRRTRRIGAGLFGVVCTVLATWAWTSTTWQGRPWSDIWPLILTQGLGQNAPVSVHAHLMLIERLLMPDFAGVSTLMAATYFAATAALLAYFAGDVRRAIGATASDPLLRRGSPTDARLGWFLVIGFCASLIWIPIMRPLPVAVNLWVTVACVTTSAIVLGLAERTGRKQREMSSFTIKDGLVIGSFHLASWLFPGLSPLGVALAAGLVLGFTRPAALRLALLFELVTGVAAQLYSRVDDKFHKTGDVGPTTTQMQVGALTVLVLSYAVVAGLFWYVRRRSFCPFVIYLLALAALTAGAIANGYVAAT